MVNLINFMEYTGMQDPSSLTLDVKSKPWPIGEEIAWNISLTLGYAPVTPYKNLGAFGLVDLVLRFFKV